MIICFYRVKMFASVTNTVIIIHMQLFEVHTFNNRLQIQCNHQYYYTCDIIYAEHKRFSCVLLKIWGGNAHKAVIVNIIILR